MAVSTIAVLTLPLLTVLTLLTLLTLLLPTSAVAHGASATEEEGEREGESEIGAEEFDRPDPPPLEELLVVPGDCPVAAPIEPGNSIDCYFDFRPDVVVDADLVDLLGFVDAVAGSEVVTCSIEVEARRLACLELFTDDFLELGSGLGRSKG